MLIPAIGFYLMGTDYALDFQFGGLLHEYGISEDKLTASQKAALFSYVSARYGLSLD